MTVNCMYFENCLNTSNICRTFLKRPSYLPSISVCTRIRCVHHYSKVFVHQMDALKIDITV